MRSEARLLLVDKHAVDQLLAEDAVVHAVREAFELHSRGEGRVFPVIREQLSTGGIFGIKAGDVQSQNLLGFKAAGFWPNNRRTGGEPHQATIVLFDPQTGRPRCVIDGNAITTVRTGAAGALGISALARADSETAAVFGTGVQAASQLNFALRTLPRLKRVRYVAVDRKPDEAFASRFAGRCHIESAANADEAVAQSDIVITATPGGGPLFDADAVRPGTHLNCVGADTRGKRELPPGVLEKARVVVDDKEQARRLGELQWAPETLCVELGDVLTGTATFDRATQDITVFDMTGLALQDLTVARLVFERASETGSGTSISWPW